MAAFVALAGVATDALAAEPLVERAGECAAVGADAARLACYDALFRTGSTAAATGEGVAAAGPTAPARAAPSATELAPEERFGLEQQIAATAQAQTQQIESRVTAVRNLAHGRQEVDLENGQTWRQTESSSSVAWRSGDTLGIRRAALGSFLASTDTSRRWLRVRRIR